MSKMSKSDTLTNLLRLSKSDASEREPLAIEEYVDNSVDESDSSPELLTYTPSDTSVSLRLRKRRPTLLSEESVANMDKARLESIFADLNSTTMSRERRSKRAEGAFKSNFADVTQEPVVYSIFDAPYFKNSQFYGFYILFWLGTGFLFLRDIIHNFFDKGSTIFLGPVYLIFSTGLLRIALTDVSMYLTIYFAYFVQYLCREGWIQWSGVGMTLQSVYEISFVSFWLVFISQAVMKDQWIGRVFLVLHMFVLLMKMHSYAFYNGYLWKILCELEFSESYLKRMHDNVANLPDGYTEEETRKMLVNSIAFCKFELLHQSSLLHDAKDTKVIDQDTQTLCDTLVKFPANINFKNFFEYTMFPTVVYELTYPRTERIRYLYLFEKLAAIVGVIFLMLVVAENSIYPLVMKCNDARTGNLPAKDRAVFFLLMLLDMIPAFMVEYLFVFYLIWDTILNAVAELSKFADRDFYGPWWSCTDWSEYARLWNKPVHRFLLRHIYHSSISAFNVSKLNASLITFTISSIVHELVMYVIFGRLRGYLFYFQMGQIPLVVFSRLPFMRDKKVLGNVMCWFGFVSGPAIICTLYLVY